MGKSSHMRYPVLFAFPLMLAACSVSHDRNDRPLDESSAATTADYLSSADSTSFTSEMKDMRSASRKRVRSADVRCDVKDVTATTFAIESIVARVGGITKESTISNESVVTKDLPYSSDSIKRVVLYSPVSNLQLKIPVASLDTVVRAISEMATFIDYRTLKEDDKTLAYLTNALRNEVQRKRGSIVAKDKDSTLQIAAYNESQEVAAIDRRMNNLSILDDAAYANFSIQLSQPEVAKVYTVVNPDQVKRAGFGTEMMASLRTGTIALRNTLLFLMEIWPFLLVATFGWLMYKRFNRKNA